MLVEVVGEERDGGFEVGDQLSYMLEYLQLEVELVLYGDLLGVGLAVEGFAGAVVPRRGRLGRVGEGLSNTLAVRVHNNISDDIQMESKGESANNGKHHDLETGARIVGSGEVRVRSNVSTLLACL